MPSIYTCNAQRCMYPICVFMFSARRKGNNLPGGKAMGEQHMDGHCMGRLQGSGGTRWHASQPAMVNGDSE